MKLKKTEPARCTPSASRDSIAFVAGIVAIFLPTANLFGVDGYWTNSGGGTWANSGNWEDGTIADGADDTAYFGFLGLDIPPNTSVTLDGARTIGHVAFSDGSGTDSWILNSGTG